MSIVEEDGIIRFNGVDGSSGEYGLPDFTLAELMERLGQAPPPVPKGSDAELNSAAQGSFAVAAGVDAGDLSQSGWAVVFPEGVDERVRQALGPLLALRQEQAGPLYRETTYRANTGKRDFLRALGADSSGPVKPKQFPYYVLLVGPPEAIPFPFQYQLSLQYAVGRVCFETPEEYANYARSVVAVERGDVKRAKTLGFAAVENDNDRATKLGRTMLVEPLITQLRDSGLADGWQIETLIGDQATKANLLPLFGGERTPALLFTASHGMEFPSGHERQREDQGALLCRDWAGPLKHGKKPIERDLYISGHDLFTRSDANLAGTIAFLFACFGGGTPAFNEFPETTRGWTPGTAAPPVAPLDFVARLPMRMLSHPAGGALAVIGHVDRAWSYSFGAAQPEINTFESALLSMSLLAADDKGRPLPVGAAMEYFGSRYAELAAGLTERLNRQRKGSVEEQQQLFNEWTEHNDARGYIIFGDPAVRLSLSESAPMLPKISELSFEGGAPAAPSPAPAEAAVLGATASISVSEAGTAASFGLFGSGEKGENLQQQIAESLRGFADQVGKTLGKAISDAADLEVRTYVADDLSQVTITPEAVQGAELRAVTRMRLDGDIDIVVPRRDGELDAQLWEVHSAMVSQAQTNRAEIIKAVASAAAGLIAALGGKS